MKHPPSKKNGSVSKWAREKKYFLKYLPEYTILKAVSFISRFLNVHPRALLYMRRAFKLGNPSGSAFPKDTIPMTSRLIAAGLWNYSFFQFNRHFYFPYWAHRQYNPKKPAFIPRSHNILSMNQTHRNWIAISFPGKEHEVSIDMAGAIMPVFDNYSIEFAILDRGKITRPHDHPDEIKFVLPDSSTVKIYFRGRQLTITARQYGIEVKGSGKGNIILSIRPFNTEGPAIISRLSHGFNSHKIGGDVNIRFEKQPDAFQLSSYADGDALAELPRLLKKKYNRESSLSRIFYRIRKKRKNRIREHIRCGMGISTAAFLYNDIRNVKWSVKDGLNFAPPGSLTTGIEVEADGHYEPRKIWEKWFNSLMQVSLPEPYCTQFKMARNHLMTLWDYDSITPGSYTYHHFWIRDAAIMMQALMLVGGERAVHEILTRFPPLVKRNGQFESQEGEFDSNGQALWIIGQYLKLTGDIRILREQKKFIRRMIHWVQKTTQRFSGVMPPGFSAEHLGVSDWYLWDNFWTLGGLQALLPYSHELEENIRGIYRNLIESLEKYLKGYRYLPAALGRKKDAGMIGSIAAAYPLKVSHFIDDRMAATLKILHDDHFFQGGFFQENIHSGINPYLTLQVAEGFLHLGDAERSKKIYDDLMQWAAPGFTFPEAVHPQSGGGCMGDGFHGWAFAEIVILIRNWFFLEFEYDIVMLTGATEDWFKQNASVQNLHSSVGNISIRLQKNHILIQGLEKDRIRGRVFIRLPAKKKVLKCVGATMSKANWNALVNKQKKPAQLVELKELHEKIEIWLK